MVRAARREHERPYNPHTSAGQGATFLVAGCNTDALGRNRVPASCRCIADQCAMWRWEGVYVPPPDAEPGKLAAGVYARAGTGFCGLANTPGVFNA